MKAVNLLPSEQKGAAPKVKPAAAPAEPSGGSVGAFAVLGALAFAVLATASYVLVGNTIKDREAELTRVKADTEVVQAQLGALKPYADFQTLAAQRVATVTQLAQGRFDWEQALRDMSRAIPSEVRLTKVNGSLSTSSSAGATGLRGARQAPAIQLEGCARTQSDVASLMSRLRIVRGVTRVALSKSEKPAALAPTAGTPGAPTQDLLCGKGRPPAFEMVVFFERAQILPTEADAAAAAAAPTTPPAGSSSSSTTPPASGSSTVPASGSSTPPATGAPSSPSASSSTPTTTGVSAP